MVVMLLPLLSALACAPGTPGDVCPELRSMRTEILHLHRQRRTTHEPMVSDARLAQIERKLGQFLGLPPGLRVRMTTISGHRREMAKPHSVSMTVVDRSSGLDLGMWTTPWSGECLSSGGLYFLRRPAGQDGGCSRHTGYTHYDGELLPLMFAALSKTTDALEAASLSVERLQVEGGGGGAQPPYVVARGSLRVEHAPGEAVVSAEERLLLGEIAAEGEPRASAGGLDQRLSLGLELLEEVELAFPHSIQLQLESPDQGRLILDPYKKEHPPLPLRVVLQRGESGWSVNNPEQQLAEGALSLGAFLRLAELTAQVTARGKEQVGVFGVALDSRREDVQACLVAVDTSTIWAAKKGTLYLLQDTGAVATVLQEVELPRLLDRGGSWRAREATAASGEVFHVEGRASDILMLKPTAPELRFGTRDYAVLGGRGLL